MGIQTVPRPPYHPDMAPCDDWMLPKLNEKLRGCDFEDLGKTKEAVTSHNNLVGVLWFYVLLRRARA